METEKKEREGIQNNRALLPIFCPGQDVKGPILVLGFLPVTPRVIDMDRPSSQLRGGHSQSSSRLLSQRPPTSKQHGWLNRRVAVLATNTELRKPIR
jgi:hypothetical protein